MFESFFAFLIAILVLVTVHEWAHFAVARYFNIKVLRFSIGFGKPIWLKKMGPDDMEFCFAPIPLGGYVRMLDTREGAVADDELHRAFDQRPPLERIAVVIAGPLINLALAAALFAFIGTFDREVLPPIIGKTASVNAVAQSALQPNDEILAINGVKTPGWNDAYARLNAESIRQSDFSISYLRAGQAETTVLDIRWDQLPKAPDLSWQDLGITPFSPIKPVLDELLQGQAAINSGLLSNDVIASIDGQPMNYWHEVVDIVRNAPNQTLNFHIHRSDVALTVPVSLGSKIDDGKMVGFLGATPKISEDDFKPYLRVYQQSLFQAIVEGFKQTYDLSILIVVSIGKMLTGQLSYENISGPITIAEYAGKSASNGLLSFLNFLAFLSVSLGVLNLLPIPLLDGGHILFYAIEYVRGLAISDKLQLKLQYIGVVILGMIMILAFSNDIIRLIN